MPGGEKVMKEIRGGLPEKDANRGLWGVSTIFLIVLVLFGFLLFYYFFLI